MSRKCLDADFTDGTVKEIKTWNHPQKYDFERRIKIQGYNNMHTKKLKDVIKACNATIELETRMDSIRNEIEQNYQLIIKHFFPYLLSTYGKWRPKLEEKAMSINFESNFWHPSQKLKSSLHFNSLSHHRFKGDQILIRAAV